MLIYSIVVTYNGEQWINICIDSLINSKLDGEHRIIVIDNGSTDKTIKLLENYLQSIEIIETHENLGFGQANNIGMKMAIENNADFIFLLNQDAWIESNVIQSLIDVSKANDNFGILSPLHWNGDGDKIDFNVHKFICESNLSRDLISDSYQNKRNIYTIEFINAAIWLLPTKSVKKVGLFDPIFFQYGEDRNYAQRMSFHQFKIALVPELKGYHDRETIMVKNMTSKKYYFINLALFISRVCDINNDGYSRLYIKYFVIQTIKLLKNLVLFNLNYAIKDIQILFKAILFTKKVYKSRVLNKQVFI
jgi:GT2 family glycosyltransferase